MVAAGAFVAGCNIVAPIAYVMEGGPKVPALYELDGERSTVVFVDDLRNRLPRRSLSALVGRAAEDALFRSGTFTPDVDAETGENRSRLISSRSAMRAVVGDSASDLTSVVDVGRTLGAEVVVYVEVEAFAIVSDGESALPAAEARVKVFDAVTNERLWPGAERGALVSARTDLLATTSILSRDDRFRLEETLANELGTVVARLFFEHERERLEDRRDRLGFGT